MRTDELISGLAQGLRPIRRLPHPVVAALGWIAFAGLVLGLAVLAFGLRHDLAQRLAGGYDLPQLVAAGATGLLAALAAFHLALPDRDRRWAWLPLPAALGWLATMGWGCVQDLARLGPEGLRLGTSFPCMAFILGFGLPLTLGIVWLTRHAALLRPGPVAALGGLSAAAFASLGLSLVHHLDAAVMVLAWHGVTVLIVTAVSALAGPRVMRAGLEGARG